MNILQINSSPRRDASQSTKLADRLVRRLRDADPTAKLVVRDLGVTPQSSAVVSAIIALARALGLRVIAEGVANIRQMDVLHRLGCGVMQGFLFSRPIPPDDLERWLEQTVLPRKATWIETAPSGEPIDTPRAGGRG